jgi:hypothetical protein
MYVRQAKQFLRNAIEGFDERKYGFASVVDLLRAAGKEGVLRLERDRQGAIRVFPGVNVTTKPAAAEASEPVIDMDENIDMAVPPERVSEPESEAPIEATASEVNEPPIIDGETLRDIVIEDETEPGDNFGNREQPHPVLDAPVPTRGSRKRKTPSLRGTKPPRGPKVAKPAARPTGRRPPRRKTEAQ